MITLAEGIASHHTDLGSAAVLDSTEVTDLSTKAGQAKPKRKRAAELTAQADTLNQEAAAILGLAPGQNAQTEGTVLYRIDGFRAGTSSPTSGACRVRALRPFYADTSIGTAKTPGPRKPKP